MRFAWLGRPCLWGDEALVYWRTCGTYGQLLQPLHADGFPPLHYELFWLIVRAAGGTPGPVAMRAVAAVCGTLLVPAVYFVASQMWPARPALTAAAFTAGSAFALFYSRDAKMYAEAWLSMTVGVGCLLWWLRTGRATAWLGWVAAGAAAGGFQTLALVGAVGLAPLLLLTQRRAHWRQGLLCLAGTGLIAAGPVGYYARFNVWTENVTDKGWDASGLAWVPMYNFGRSGPDQLRYLATTFLTGWEWPRLASAVPASWWQPPPAPDGKWIHWSTPFVHVPLRQTQLLTTAAMVVALILVAGMLPWRTARDLVRPTPADLAPDAGRPEPAWRATLWLCAWIGLPVYGFYCRSMAGFETPAELLGLAPHFTAWMTASVVVAIGLVVAVCFRSTRASAIRLLQTTAVFVALVAAAQGMGVAMASAARAAAEQGRPWASVWVPRYLGFVWPGVAIGVGVLIDRLPTRSGRASALAIVLAANLAMFAFRLTGPTEPPVDRMAADVWAGQPPSDTLTWTRLTDHSWSQIGPGDGNLFSDPGRFYLQQFARRPLSPTLFKASLGTFHFNRGDPVYGVPATLGPGVRKVIVWEQFDRPPVETDDLLPRLPGWHRTNDESFAIHDVWTTQDHGWYRRREYQRLPATRP